MARTSVRCLAGVIAAGLWLMVFSLSSAQAADEGGVVAGTWTVKLKVVKSTPDFTTKSGVQTYSFGEGCAPGKPCKMTRQVGKADPTATTGQSAGGSFTWHDAQALSCVDKVTGAVSVQHGADYDSDTKMAPSAFATRDGVRYVTALTGTYDEHIKTNGAGRAVDCRSSNGKFEVRAHSVLTATMVPLAAAPTATSKTPLAADREEAEVAGTVDAFKLPQSRRQGVSALAVAEERRSSVPGALTAPSDAVSNIGARLPKDLLLVALIGLLMIFPAQIFNSTYEENHERIDARLARWRLRKRRDEAAVISRARRLLIFFLCVVVGTLLGGLLDPNFGTNTPSYALLVGVFLSVCVVVIASALAGRTFRGVTHRTPDWYLRAIPSALLIAVVCVAVSRLSNFQPGYLYGILGGAVFAGALDRRSEGRSESATFGALLVLSLLAWLAFGAVSSAAVDESASFWVLGADAFLGSLFIGGIEGLLFGMIPLQFLPGYRIKNLSWLVWGALTALVVYIFVHVLLLPESGYLGRSTAASVNLTLGLLVAFALASGVFWLWFRLRSTETSSQEPTASPPPSGSLPEPAVSA